MSNDCAICCDTFTKVSRKRIECPYCQLIACSNCVTRYLLDSVDRAHCMGCKNEWSQDVLKSSFNKKFYQQTYRDHMAKVFMDIQKNLLPQTQGVIEQISEIQEKLNKEKQQETKLIEIIQSYRQELQGNRRTIYGYQLQLEYIKTGELQQDNTKVFTHKCPITDCRGYLSSRWKCGTCNVYVCKDCMAPKGKDDEHKCNPDDVKSVEFMKKDAKPCPSCSVMIHKQSGCDVMFCTQCHTAFNWRTGRIQTQNIHNPHYFEYLREQGNGNIIGNQRQIICGWEFPRSIPSCRRRSRTYIMMEHFYISLLETRDIEFQVTHRYTEIPI